MSDILIRGMEMPKSCRECFACFPGRDDNDEPTTYCTLTEPTSPADCWGVIDGIDHQRQRMDFCPLHELPAHGDLIDRDALLADGWMDLHKTVVHMGGCAVHDLLLKNPTIPVIVPASEEAANDPKT